MATYRRGANERIFSWRRDASVVLEVGRENICHLPVFAIKKGYQTCVLAESKQSSTTGRDTKRGCAKIHSGHTSISAAILRALSTHRFSSSERTSYAEATSAKRAAASSLGFLSGWYLSDSCR